MERERVKLTIPGTGKDLQIVFRLWDLRCLKYLTFLFVFIFFHTCQKAFDPADLADARYLHIAHTRAYSDARDRVMPAVEKLDFSGYDVLILGGDLAYESSGSLATLHYLDSIFDLKSPGTLWTLGNHDYHDQPELIPQITKRPNAYVFYKNGITFLNLDSQEDRCHTRGKQLDLFKTVTDTLKNSRTLILLHHKLLWMLDNGEMQKQVDEVANGGFGGCSHCIPPNNFYQDVYPRLAELQRSGIQVICVAGDIGVKVNEFEYVNEDGVTFLASGLKDGAAHNKVLVFQHQPDDGALVWKFEPLSGLPQRPK